MKIRYRITLWITLAGVLASLVLSLIVLFDMVDEPYELLDQELAANAKALAANFQLLRKSIPSPNNNQTNYNTPYWVRITDRQQRVVFESELASKLDLPLKDTKKGYSVNTDIPLNQVVPESDDEEDDLATFRVRSFTYTFSGLEYMLQIARPVENINQEIIEMIVTIEVGLALSALFLVLVSYYFAGRILQPIQNISNTAKEFNEKALGKRITLGANRDEIYELSSSLNTMFDRLQFSFLRQKEFIANASHELKTPITMLRLSLEESLQDPQITDSQRELLESQNKTVLRIDRLIKNLLDLSSLELSETIKLEKFPLAELVESIIEDFGPIMKKQNIHFAAQMDDRIFVRADREKIKRVFINLFENAVKYNQDNGEIRLQVEHGKQDRNVIILLFNTGPGIPLEDHERVFDQFYRVEKSRASALGGFGLGLTIVKRIVDLHGGSISLTSKPESWTQVQIILPILFSGKTD